MRRRREPSELELALWKEVSRSVRPLKAPKSTPKVATLIEAEKTGLDSTAKPPVTSNKRAVTPKPMAPKAPLKKSLSSLVPAASPGSLVPLASRATLAPRATPAPLVPLERRMRTALKRGTKPIEAKMDLHGMRQDEAHVALVAFIHRSSARGAGLVLVVTGKGAEKGIEKGFGKAKVGDAAADGRERGVLRRLVPHWLRLGELGHLVIGFEEAHPNHGGSGALYVRLRRSANPFGDLPDGIS